MTPLFADINSLSEDQRIDLIGHRAIDHHEVIGFIVEDEKKAERYLKKLQAKFPTIRLIGKFPNSPIKDLMTIKVGPPLQ